MAAIQIVHVRIPQLLLIIPKILNIPKSSKKTTYKKVQEFNSKPTKVPWMPEKKVNDKRQKSDKIYTLNYSQFYKMNQSPKFERKNNYSNRLSSPKRFSSPNQVTLADLNANAYSLSNQMEKD